MKSTFLVSLAAILAVLTLVCPTVMAADLSISGFSLDVNGEGVSTSTVIAAEAGDIVPLTVTFTAGQDATAVRVKAEIDGYRDDITSKTSEFNLISGSLYTKSLSIQLPSDIDPYEDYTLKVSLVSQEGDYGPQEYTFRVQRPTYNVEILDADCSNSVAAGSDLAIDVVVKNRGYEELEDIFVVASIPELGIQKRAYFEDLTALDDDDDERDSAERRVYLRIPSNVDAGVYELQIEAYNADSSQVIKKNIAIVGSAADSTVVAPIKSKEISMGKVKGYDLVIINSGDNAGVYEIIPEAVEGLIVSPEEAVVVVDAGESRVVKVNVKGLETGTYTFAVDVNSGDELVDKVIMNAVVTGPGFAGNVAVLTLVLAIIFVVLLVVLIVLLTRKPEKVEEFEESYY